MDEQELTLLVKKEVMEWFSSQENQTDGYEYEKTFVSCWRSIGQKVLQQSMGKIPRSKNEKKTKNESGPYHCKQ